MEPVFRLRLRSRTALWAGSTEQVVVAGVEDVPAWDLAIVVCDMWDRHWCAGATARVDAMAPATNAALTAARRAGAQIIHAPSDTMAFYQDTPWRARAQAAARTEPPAPLPLTDPPLPIDDSDGGCDSGEHPWHKAWTRQHPAIEVTGDDAVTDDGREVYNLLQSRGIGQVAICGVHTNMCVLGRSFGIRQLTRWGIRCYLIRDLTDAMYNPAMPPHVSHERGTELVIEHIERHWCPTILSADLQPVSP